MTNRLLKNPAALLLQSNRTTYSGRGVLGCWMFAGALLAAAAQLHAQSTGLFVNSSNNVGIGTTAPLAKLSVTGASSAGDTSDQIGIFQVTTGTGANTDNKIIFGVHNGDYSWLQALQPGASTRCLLLNPMGGNIGIGPAMPGTSLDVFNGTQSATANPGNAALRVTAAQGANPKFLNVGYDPTLDAGYLQPIHSGSGGFFSNLLLNPNGGNVGIGTTNPGTKLEIDQNGTAYNIGYGGWWSGFRTSAQTGVFGFNQDDRACIGLGGNVYNRGFSANSMGIMNGSTTAEDIYLINQNGPGAGFMVLKASGNVGIDTSSPGYTLDVNGQVHAASFVASSGNNYADFVFKPGYKVPSLSETEASIKKEGHLPGIPSEAEAKAHGIDLASMQVKLLQKIEELTLHQIEQQKLLENQTERLDDQSKRIEQLEQENTELRAQL